MALQPHRIDGSASAGAVTYRKSAGRSGGVWIGLLLGGLWLGYAILLSVISPDMEMGDRLLELAAPLALLICVGALWIGRGPRRTDTLSLDESGVSIVEGARRRFFAWGEIGRIRKYLDGDPEYPIEVVAIERMGDLTYVPHIGDIRGFPVPADDLVALLRARKAAARLAESPPGTPQGSAT